MVGYDVVNAGHSGPRRRNANPVGFDCRPRSSADRALASEAMCAGSTPVGGTECQAVEQASPYPFSYRVSSLVQCPHSAANARGLKEKSYAGPTPATRTTSESTNSLVGRIHIREEMRRLKHAAQSREILRRPRRKEHALQTKWRGPCALTALQLIRPPWTAPEICLPQLIEELLDLVRGHRWSSSGPDRWALRRDTADLGGDVRSAR
jgi:hypothetical protein